MSSRRRPEPAPADDVGLELALLCDALDVLEGGAFIFAVCEEGPLRERLVRHVTEHLAAEGGRGLVEVELSPEQPDLAAQLERRLLYQESEQEGTGDPAPRAAVRDEDKKTPVFFVHTHQLADAWTPVDTLPQDDPVRVQVEGVRRALRALNYARERIARLDAPLVFWLGQNALVQVAQHAADVFAARGGLFTFEAAVRAPDAPLPMRGEVVGDLLDRFHRTLLPPEELRRRAALYEELVERERSADAPHLPRVARLYTSLADIYRELDEHERAEACLVQAAEAYRAAIAAREETEGKDQDWARLHGWLGLTYTRMLIGDRGEHLARAAASYQAALTVHTPEASSLDYAATQNNLGNAYQRMPAGDRAENLARAIECYREALRFRTPEAAPLDYATTQSNLGNAYQEKPTGNRAENLARAVRCYQEALRFHTPEAAPLDYARTQNNLGITYLWMPTGDRGENLARAIECYREALRFYTPETAPLDYARTQNNLGVAYLEQPTGDRAENLARAIQCYQEALRFRTVEAAPLDYALTQNNQGNTYAQLPTGDRAENLARAIECYHEALRFRTAEAMPLGYAMTQNNLGNAYQEMPAGDRAENLARAVEHYRRALAIWTAEAFPREHEIAARNLALAQAALEALPPRGGLRGLLRRLFRR